MKIVAVDPFYLKMPNITTDADGTQDTLAVSYTHLTLPTILRV